MSDRARGVEPDELVLEYEINATPAKVWRAISIADYRDRWLPKDALASAEAVSMTPGQEIQYRMRDCDPPFLESLVTFQVFPNSAGFTTLRISHQLTRAGSLHAPAANSNEPPLMLAA